MAIQKLEYYEGAAIYRLLCSGGVRTVAFQDPFFLLNDQVFIYLKYTTKKRSPWGFTFSPDEAEAISNKLAKENRMLVLGLVCGFDGVVALRAGELKNLTTNMRTPFGISCYRDHGEHYKIYGPDGELNYKIAPSDWKRLLVAEPIYR